MLGAIALVGLRPWGTTSLVPNLRLSPGLFEVALGDAVEVAPAKRFAVADASPVGAARPTLAARPAPAPNGGRGAEPGVSQGRPVSGSVPVATAKQPAAVPVPVSPPPTPEPAPVPPVPALAPLPVATPAPVLVANFENGLQGWSTSAADDALPGVAGVIVREGGRSSVIRLTGTESSSRLILGGDGNDSGADAVQIHEGDEYAFAFSFYIQTMVYGKPGVDNLIMRLESDASDARVFGLQLWGLPEDEWQSGLGGLWSSGEAVGGDRFLAPVSERAWHDVVVHFKGSSQGAGFYEIYLDGELVDARNEVSTITPGSGFARIEVGLFRDGDRLQGTSEIRLDAAKLGDTLESVQP